MVPPLTSPHSDLSNILILRLWPGMVINMRQREMEREERKREGGGDIELIKRSAEMSPDSN